MTIPTRLLGIDEVQQRLRAMADEAGGVTALAARLKVSKQYLHQVLTDREYGRPPSCKLLDALGLAEVTLYHERQQ